VALNTINLTSNPLYFGSVISVGGCHMTLTDVSNMSLNDRLATSPGTETKT
jgi:hypothetical protein